MTNKILLSLSAFYKETKYKILFGLFSFCKQTKNIYLQNKASHEIFTYCSFFYETLWSYLWRYPWVFITRFKFQLWSSCPNYKICSLTQVNCKYTWNTYNVKTDCGLREKWASSVKLLWVEISTWRVKYVSSS